MIQLGSRGRDRITGFAGVVTGRCEYLTGCHQVMLAPRVGDDGAFKEPHWFDEQRIEVDTTEDLVVLDNGASPGSDKAAPTR
ncbi:MAG: hypothetical protein ACK4TP_10170 [Hyphomicrobium sp.]